jgi:hypothetical protein
MVGRGGDRQEGYFDAWKTKQQKEQAAALSQIPNPFGEWVVEQRPNVRQHDSEPEPPAAALQPQRQGIFLCYRRKHTQGFAGRIYDNLASRYGREKVYRDVNSTPSGVEFASYIESRIAKCGVMIVLIGNAWLSVKDSSGKRCLGLPKDSVRQEIEAAMRQRIHIMPVCVQGAPMPSKNELPRSIAGLAGIQNEEVTDRRWEYDMGEVIKGIDRLMAREPTGMELIERQLGARSSRKVEEP